MTQMYLKKTEKMINEGKNKNNEPDFLSHNTKGGSGIVENTLDYQSSDRMIDPPLLRSFG